MLFQIEFLLLLYDFGRLHNFSVPQFILLENKDERVPSSWRSGCRSNELVFAEHGEPCPAHRKFCADDIG